MPKTLSNYPEGGLRLYPNYSILPIYGWRIGLCFMLPGDVSMCKGLQSLQERNNELLTGRATFFSGNRFYGQP